jgi:hypothetical protein
LPAGQFEGQGSAEGASFSGVGFSA